MDINIEQKALMGMINFFHPEETYPGNQIELTIKPGQSLIAYIKIANTTNCNWPVDSVMRNNINDNQEQFSLKAYECIYREIKIHIDKQMMMTGKEVVFWFTDCTGLNRIGQAIIFKL